MFLDEARIFVSSGRGGDGMVHFRREKYVPLGGPDGGDGGRGGDIILEVSPTLNTLSSFRHTNRFHAEEGRRGGSSNKTGRDGGDTVIRVPPGTIVRHDDETGEVLADLVEAGQRLVVRRGGRGGRGNARFATSRNQAPRMAEKGEPGEGLWLRLELRLIADVGIVGVPNAGKSTLLAALTHARPKIADYPFTTLEPNLGVVPRGERDIVIADIPGLIEGAHAGAGLGTAFLRHVRRTRALIHLIDGAADDPLVDFSQINSELALFDPALGERPQVVAVNKIDLPEVRDRWPKLEADFASRGVRANAISALARTGLNDLLNAVLEALQKAPAEVPEESVPVYRPEPDPTDYAVGRDPDGSWRLSGRAIERAAAMTYWENDEAVRRFQHLLVRLGVEEALRKSGARAGDTVRIGEFELEWMD